MGSKERKDVRVGEARVPVANIWHQRTKDGGSRSVLFMRASGVGGEAEIDGEAVEIYMPLGSADVVIEFGSLSAPDGYDRRYVVKGSDLVQAVRAIDQARRAERSAKPEAAHG